MKAIIPNTPEQVRETANSMIENTEQQAQSRKDVFQAALKTLGEIDPNSGGFEGVAVLLSLPDDHFALIAPTFLSEVERSVNNANDQLAMAQALNANGLRVEDIRKEYEKICEQIDDQLTEISAIKKDFLKRLLGLMINSVAETEGVAKRHILIPIEYCHEDAKMPTYAHLTDAGMDIYLTEDVTIHPGETVLIPTGIKVALPVGYELQVRPKSGRSLKSKLRIANTPGTIDAGYRDEIGIIADNIDPVIRSAEMDENGRLTNILWGSDITLSKGEKIAQLVLSEVPKAVFYEVESVEKIENDGRKGGYGSSGDR